MNEYEAILPGLYAEAFASSLDPHSSFISTSVLDDFQISMHLSLEGIGAALTSEDGITRIETLLPGGSADRDGTLRPKDKIIAVAQEGEKVVPTIDMDLREVVKMIRGKKGTKVTLTILRDSKKSSTFDVTLERDKIDVAEQAAKITYENRKVGERNLKIGIIDLPSFYGGDEGGRSSYQDVKNLISQAKENKVDGLVLDLSRNGGGLLQDAVRISGLFLRLGGVVATKDSFGRVEVLEDEDEEVEWSGPLVVLISPASASASEIEGHGRAGLVILLGVFGVFALHTAEIWAYAAVYQLLGEGRDFTDALYFSTTAFASLGFGDIVLSQRWRLVSAIEAANGVILFAWSTAFLLTLTRRVGVFNHDWLGHPEKD